MSAAAAMAMEQRCVRLEGTCSSDCYLDWISNITRLPVLCSFIMIKPDGTQRALIGEIIKRFEQKGYYLRGMKYINVPKELAEEHYVDLSSKPFYSGLVEYIVRYAFGICSGARTGGHNSQLTDSYDLCSAPVVAMVWEGKEVVKTGRQIIGSPCPT